MQTLTYLWTTASTDAASDANTITASVKAAPATTALLAALSPALWLFTKAKLGRLIEKNGSFINPWHYVLSRQARATINNKAGHAFCHPLLSLLSNIYKHHHYQILLLERIIITKAYFLTNYEESSQVTHIVTPRGL